MKRKKSWIKRVLSKFFKNTPSYKSLSSSGYTEYDHPFGNTPSGVSVNASGFITSDKDIKEDTREVKKLVEVFKEILQETPSFSLQDLDKKVKMIRHRAKILNDYLGIQNTSDESKAVYYLENRKRFKKFGHLFSWPVTNRDAIEKLLKKYKLQEVNIEGYYKTVPMEGIEEIKKFAEAFEKVTEYGDPEFKLIVDEGGKETKKDPILLAQSPFGNWMYVLGAWDKEILYVDEIIYRGK